MGIIETILIVLAYIGYIIIYPLRVMFATPVDDFMSDAPTGGWILMAVILYIIGSVLWRLTKVCWSCFLIAVATPNHESGKFSMFIGGSGGALILGHIALFCIGQSINLVLYGLFDASIVIDLDSLVARLDSWIGPLL